MDTVATERLCVSCRASRYSAGSIKTPMSAPANRHPNGVMPKMAMPTLIKSLPSGGCVVS